MGTAESPVKRSETTGMPHDGSRSHYGDQTSVDQIQTDIDRTRGEIDETLDALGERLNPRHLLDDVFDLFRSKGGGHDYGRTARSIGRQAAQQIKDHPVPAMLIGAGLAWMFFEEDEDEYTPHPEPPMYSGSYVDARTGEPYDLETYGREWREEQETGPGMGEKAREKIAGAGESLKHAGQSVRGAAAGAAARAGEWAGGAREGAAHMKHSAGRYRRQAGVRARRLSRDASHRMQEGYAYGRDRFEDALDQYPLAVGAGVLAIGLLAGLALPRTRREDEWMGEASDELKERAQETAGELRDRGAEALQSTTAAAREEAERQGLAPGELMEKVKHVAGEAMHAAEQTAHEEGIDPAGLKEKGQAVAERTKEQGRQEAQHSKEELRT